MASITYGQNKAQFEPLPVDKLEGETPLVRK